MVNIIQDVLEYRLDKKSLGPMRLLIEDALELWKKNILDLSDEELYFYSRELRVLINEYDYRKIPRRAVYNLIFNKPRLENLGNFVIDKGIKANKNNTNGLFKTKIKEDKKPS